MKFTAQNIADFLGGTVQGDANVSVWTVAKIEEGEPGALAFLSNTKYEQYIYTTAASVVIVAKDFEPKNEITATLVRVEDPYGAFAKLLEMYAAARPVRQGVSERASVAEDAQIGQGVYVGDFAVIESGAVVGDDVKIYPQVFVGEGVKVGSGTVLHPGVKIYEGCEIGCGVIIHAGTIIGSDGFGFAPQADGTFAKIPQIGIVVLEDGVEIGANCTIDRATMGSTVVKQGAKIDNLVQLAHNVVVGENTVIAAQSGLAGSTKVGKSVMIGGQVGLAGHMTIADRVKIGSQSGLNHNVEKEGEFFLGSPAQSGMGFHKSHKVFKELPQLQRDVKKLMKLLDKEE